jgi:hypothetical protein
LAGLRVLGGKSRGSAADENDELLISLERWLAALDLAFCGTNLGLASRTFSTPKRSRHESWTNGGRDKRAWFSDAVRAIKVATIGLTSKSSYIGQTRQQYSDQYCKNSMLKL